MLEFIAFKNSFTIGLDNTLKLLRFIFTDHTIKLTNHIVSWIIKLNYAYFLHGHKLWHRANVLCSNVLRCTSFSDVRVIINKIRPRVRPSTAPGLER